MLVIISCQQLFAPHGGRAQSGQLVDQAPSLKDTVAHRVQQSKSHKNTSQEEDHKTRKQEIAKIAAIYAKKLQNIGYQVTTGLVHKTIMTSYTKQQPDKFRDRLNTSMQHDKQNLTDSPLFKGLQATCIALGITRHIPLKADPSQYEQFEEELIKYEQKYPNFLYSNIIFKDFLFNYSSLLQNCETEVTLKTLSFGLLKLCTSTTKKHSDEEIKAAEHNLDHCIYILTEKLTHFQISYDRTTTMNILGYMALNGSWNHLEWSSLITKETLDPNESTAFIDEIKAFCPPHTTAMLLRYEKINTEETPLDLLEQCPKELFTYIEQTLQPIANESKKLQLGSSTPQYDRTPKPKEKKPTRKQRRQLQAEKEKELKKAKEKAAQQRLLEQRRKHERKLKGQQGTEKTEGTAQTAQTAQTTKGLSPEEKMLQIQAEIQKRKTSQRAQQRTNALTQALKNWIFGALLKNQPNNSPTKVTRKERNPRIFPVRFKVRNNPYAFEAFDKNLVYQQNHPPHQNCQCESYYDPQPYQPPYVWTAPPYLWTFYDYIWSNFAKELTEYESLKYRAESGDVEARRRLNYPI